MAQSIFKVGDTVTLKSGGPKMTVKKIISQYDSIFGDAPTELKVNEINVSWFDKDELKTADFTEPQLELVK